MNTRLFLASAIAAAIAVPAITGKVSSRRRRQPFEAEVAAARIAKAGQERPPDRQLLVRGHLEAGRPEGRLAVRSRADVRPARQRAAPSPGPSSGVWGAR